MNSKIKKIQNIVITLIITAALLLTGCAGVTNSAGAPDRSAGSEETQQQQNGELVSYVTIDVNPSIQLTVCGGVVTAATAYNDDGTEVLTDYNVVGMDPQAAVTTLVNAFSAQGYINAETKSAIVITVTGQGEKELLERIRVNAEEQIRKLGADCVIVATPVSNQIRQTAQNCGLTPGRYMLLARIAEQEGITIDEAKEKYGSLKMAGLVAMVQNVDGMLRDTGKLNDILSSLTSEQLQILNAARDAYETAMKAAQQAFNDVRKAAQDVFKAAMETARDAFLTDKDNDKLKAAQDAAKEIFAAAKKAALQAVKDARTAAKEAFIAAIYSLGLDEVLTDKLLDWRFDMDFNFNFNFDNQPGEKTDNGQSGNKDKQDLPGDGGDKPGNPGNDPGDNGKGQGNGNKDGGSQH